LGYLGLATKIKKRGGRQDFKGKGGVPFLAFNPPQLVENIGQDGTFELGRSLDGLLALMDGFRAADYPSTNKGHPWFKLRDEFRAAVTKVTKEYSMGLTGAHLTPHILHKFLLMNGDVPHLTVPEMADLFPDEQQIFEELPFNLRDRGRLATAVSCPDLYITYYNSWGLSHSMRSCAYVSRQSMFNGYIYIYLYINISRCVLRHELTN
jgi:hypothetical protein